MDLRESILKLEGHPHCPTKVYLDLEQGVVQPYLDTGGAPREAHEGRWVWVCTAPARVVPYSSTIKLANFYAIVIVASTEL